MNELSSKVVEYIDSIVESYVDYTETHQDSGNGHSHLPREGGFHYNNCESKIMAFLYDNDINSRGLSIEQLSELVLDNFEMVSGHIFSTEKENELTIDSYHVSEIENQLQISQIAKELGLNLTAKRLKIILEDSNYFHKVEGDEILSYCVSDCIWSAIITADHLEDLIKDHCESWLELSDEVLSDLKEFLTLNLDSFKVDSLEYGELLLTVATNDDGDQWSYQTGDNSFTGGAYSLPHWATTYIDCDSTPETLLEDITEQLQALINL